MKLFKVIDKVENEIISVEIGKNGAGVCRNLANVGFFKLWRIEDIKIIETDLTTESGSDIKVIDPKLTLEELGFKREEPANKSNKPAEEVAKNIINREDKNIE